MKTQAVNFSFFVAVAAGIALITASTAVAQTNTMLGTGALASPSSPDLFDSAFGFNALNGPTSGTNNTACGASALSVETNGFDNTASGFEALKSNTSGTGNTATGASALKSNTTGLFNTA